MSRWCWHSWTKWSEPGPVHVVHTFKGHRVGDGREMIQKRHCIKCKKAQERIVPTRWA